TSPSLSPTKPTCGSILGSNFSSGSACKVRRSALKSAKSDSSAAVAGAGADCSCDSFSEGVLSGCGTPWACGAYGPPGSPTAPSAPALAKGAMPGMAEAIATCGAAGAAPPALWDCPGRRMTPLEGRVRASTAAVAALAGQRLPAARAISDG